MMSIPKTDHTTRRTLIGMSKALIVTLVASAAIVGGGIAAEAQSSHPARCKTLGVEQTVEQRVTMSGGVQTRTVTVTKRRCKGKISVSVTYGGWH